MFKIISQLILNKFNLTSFCLIKMPEKSVSERNTELKENVIAGLVHLLLLVKSLRKFTCHAYKEKKANSAAKTNTTSNN